jgi:hypothetical protein
MFDATSVASSWVSDRSDPVKRGYSGALSHGNSTGDPNASIKTKWGWEVDITCNSSPTLLPPQPPSSKMKLLFILGEWNRYQSCDCHTVCLTFCDQGVNLEDLWIIFRSTISRYFSIGVTQMMKSCRFWNFNNVIRGHCLHIHNRQRLTNLKCRNNLAENLILLFCNVLSMKDLRWQDYNFGTQHEGKHSYY